MSEKVNKKRVRELKGGELGKGAIVYWMSRDQRAYDNWALFYAQELAQEVKEGMIVVFCLVKNFLGATKRQYDFMFDGLKETEKIFEEKNIGFEILAGKPELKIPAYLKKVKAGGLVTDFDPLKIKRGWKDKVKAKIEIPFYEVDAHNVVPCFAASDKLEFAAHTLRPKIHKKMDDFLTDFPNLIKHNYDLDVKIKKTRWNEIYKDIRFDKNVKMPEWIKPGSNEAGKILEHFIFEKLSDYNEKRNDPTIDGQSNLSPYLHFGQISAQRVAFEVQKSKAAKKSREAFIEELVVRKELSDNFCFYNENYDNAEGFHDWAKETLNNHRNDKREYIYGMEEFEKGKTHDDLWNAAQMEMVNKGKMHGFMRMYWAKKILQWTKSPEEAMEIAIYLNDKYEIDGRDPNGYTGIAWSIGGVHDHAWQDRNVFGKIRYMSYNGCKRKFDVEKYIRQNLPEKEKEKE